MRKNVAIPNSAGGDNDCYAECDETLCVCAETVDDPGCCDLACDICWAIIDAS